MSQRKVDYYKEQKRNRQAIMKKEKMTKRLEIALIVIILAALLVWFGFMIAQNRMAASAGDAGTTTELSLGAFDKYIEELSDIVDGDDEAEAEEAGEEGASEEAGEETAESEEAETSESSESE